MEKSGYSTITGYHTGLHNYLSQEFHDWHHSHSISLSSLRAFDDIHGYISLCKERRRIAKT